MSLLSLTPHTLTQNQMYYTIAVTKCCKQLQILFSNHFTACVRSTVQDLTGTSLVCLHKRVMYSGMTSSYTHKSLVPRPFVYRNERPGYEARCLQNLCISYHVDSPLTFHTQPSQLCISDSCGFKYQIHLHMSIRCSSST